MSPGNMLSTQTTTSLTSTLPKLAADGSNWIIWKTQMQVFLGAKILNHLDSWTAPTKPQPLTDAAWEDETKKYEKKSKKYTKWMQEDTEVKNYIISTIPNSLLIKTLNYMSAGDLWKTICKEHEDKTKIFQMEMTC